MFVQSTQRIRGPYGILPASPHSAGVRSDCGGEDEGDYVPVDQMYEKADPEPTYDDPCQKAEFKHIGEFFDLGKNNSAFGNVTI